MNFINFNGKIQRNDAPALLVNNRSYRYGDGIFETIKVENQAIRLKEYHFERFFSGLAILKYEIPKLFTHEKLEKEIFGLCQKNNCEKLARVRLSAFRGNGGLFDNNKSLQYVIECWPLDNSVNKLNENGLIIDIFPHALKSCDVYANLKSSSALCYVQAALYAAENKLNDCLVLNTDHHIADSSIANIFLVKDGKIKTSSLQQGCVNGVMRKWLIRKLNENRFSVEEGIIAPSDLAEADELFLTNAIKGIMWVGRMRDKIYVNTLTRKISGEIMETKD